MPIKGIFDPIDSPLAYITPDITPPIKPGPAVTAIALIQSKSRLALSRADSIT
jgi:hypothetical protein